MAVDYWVLVPKQSEMNVSGPVADAYVVPLPQGSAIDNQLLSNYTGPVTVNGRTGYLRAGPFTSMAAVNAYLKVGAKNASTPVPGIQIKPGGGVAVSNPVTGALTDVNSFLSRLTSANTWLRVGEFVLGALLILAGALKLSGASSDLADVAKLATKVVK